MLADLFAAGHNPMTYAITKAVRESTAFIGALCGPSGSGKTKSALLIATGLSPSGKILVKDSEGSRALEYAPDRGDEPDHINTFSFSHEPWEPPYTPESLGRTLQSVVSRGFEVIIVDSMSSEHEDEGGLQDMAEAELQVQKDKGWELNTASAWARPKAQHKKHIVRWLRTARCHVIFCCRASEKVRFEKVERDGRMRTVVVPVGWTPVCEKNLLYDVTTSLLFTPNAPGVPKPIKLNERHKRFFPPDTPITRDAGAALAQWCAGGVAPKIDASAPAEPADGDLERMAWAAARDGSMALAGFWGGLNKASRSFLGRPMLDRLKLAALDADAMQQEDAT